MKDTPLVSIITVNYNQEAVTAEFLQSLSLLTYNNFEVIVVDNGSANPSSRLKKQFPFITHITSPQNIGFAGGNNIGLQYASGEYVFFVNNDTVVTPDLLPVLVDHLNKHPKCGIVCPKIKYYSNPEIIQYAGAIGLHSITCRSHDIGYLQKDDGSFDDVRKTDLPNGAAMMVPMKLIKRLGGMSETFFLYYEELDWAARFVKAGYEVHYAGTASILHKESVSTGINSPFKIFYLYRNRLLFIRRNQHGWKRIVSGSFFILASVPAHSIKHFFRKEFKHIGSIFRAVCWHLSHKPFQEPFINSSSLKSQLTIDKGRGLSSIESKV